MLLLSSAQYTCLVITVLPVFLFGALPPGYGEFACVPWGSYAASGIILTNGILTNGGVTELLTFVRQKGVSKWGVSSLTR